MPADAATPFDPGLIPFERRREEILLVERLCGRFAQARRRGDAPPISEWVAELPEPVRFRAQVALEAIESDEAELRGAGESPRISAATQDSTLREFPISGGRRASSTDADADRTADRRAAAAFAESGAGPDGFELLELIGRGSMGVVYRARDRRLGRVVAIKFFNGAWGSDASCRLLREAQAIARLKHPNVVEIHLVSDHAGRPFLVLEYVAGGSLGQNLARGDRFDAKRSAALAEALARALQAAHEQNVVHRDLKPANILLTPDGQPKLSDFGLARLLDDAAGETLSRQVLGTPGYMPPEQAVGDSRLAGPPADLYSLGALLYHLLTGRPPFQGTVEQILYRVVHEVPVPPRTIDRTIPRDLETICLRCLQKDPRQRYAQALDLADDLRRFLEGRPIVARRERWWESLAGWCRRRPAVAAMSGGLIAALVAGLAVALTLWQQTRSARRLADAHLARVNRSMSELSVNLVELAGTHRDLGARARAFSSYERAVQVQRSLVEEMPHAAAYQGDLAKALLGMGELQRQMGDLGAARSTLTEARQLFLGLSERHPAEPAAAPIPLLHAALASAADLNLAQVERDAGNLDAVRAHLEGGAARLERVLRNRASDGLPPERPADVLRIGAQLQSALGDLALDENRLDDAEAAFQRARDALEAISAASSTIRRQRADLHNSLAILRRQQNRGGDAVAEYDVAVRLLRELVEAEPLAIQHAVALARTLTNRGRRRELMGDAERAGEDLREAVTLRRSLVRRDPDNPSLRVELANSQSALAALELPRLGWAHSAVGFQEAVDALEAILEQHPDHFEAAELLAAVRQRRGLARVAALVELDQAAADFQRAAVEHQRLRLAQPRTPSHLENLAADLANLGALRLEHPELGPALPPLAAATLMYHELALQSPGHPKWTSYRKVAAGLAFEAGKRWAVSVRRALPTWPARNGINPVRRPAE